MGSSTKRDVGHLPSKPLIVKPVKPNLTYLKRVLRQNDGATRRQMPSETPTSVSLKSGWRQWVSVLWAIKLDHLQPVELILSQYISTFLTFILGGPIPYYPRERKRGKSRGWKWGKGIHSKLNETQGFLYLGHSNLTICSLLSWFCSINFPPFLLSYWGVQLPQRLCCPLLCRRVRLCPLFFF